MTILLCIIYSLVQKFKITLEILIANRTLAHFQLDLRIVVHVVDAHLIGDAETAERDVSSVHCVVMTRGDQRVPLRGKTISKGQRSVSFVCRKYTFFIQ